MTSLRPNTGRWLITCADLALEVDTTIRTETGLWTCTDWRTAAFGQVDGDFNYQWWLHEIGPVVVGRGVRVGVSRELLQPVTTIDLPVVDELRQLSDHPWPVADVRVVTTDDEAWDVIRGERSWFLRSAASTSSDAFEALQPLRVGHGLVVGFHRPHEKTPSPHWWWLGRIRTIEELL